jgi:hypothetical protein
MEVLVDGPRAVACDLAGMTAEGSAMLARNFAPVRDACGGRISPVWLGRALGARAGARG